MGLERTFHTEVHCEHCGAHFATSFEEPAETFEATCPHCGTYYPELYV